ncbi:MAG: hypothetical protein F6K47_12375 [Symploca sp. SIO2E6]|nr:hypothetical protein [Symploca sp. SIO2E6]
MKLSAFLGLSKSRRWSGLRINKETRGRGDAGTRRKEFSCMVVKKFFHGDCLAASCLLPPASYIRNQQQHLLASICQLLDGTRSFA